MSDQRRDPDQSELREAAQRSGSGGRLRKRWIALGLLVAFVAYQTAQFAYDANQRASYRAELASLPQTPCIEALTSPPLSQFPNYVAGGFNRTFPGTRAAELFQNLNGLGCLESEVIPFFLQFPAEIDSLILQNDRDYIRYTI
ncbi:MAG: hypothetical protein AAF234_19520, partial [Pseudomonadota bacterium]